MKGKNDQESLKKAGIPTGFFEGLLKTSSFLTATLKRLAALFGGNNIIVNGLPAGNQHHVFIAESSDENRRGFLRVLLGDLVAIVDRDHFLAFCFGKDNSDLLKLLNYCKRNKIPSIVITDYVLGLAAANADFVLELKRGPLQIFHSMSVPVLVAESISLFVSKLRKDIAYRNLSKLDELRKEYDI